ncbi:MAG TPA: LicD family protein [Labilithrix sp.]|nr:LicD family protein [Labilithrix sp.]
MSIAPLAPPLPPLGYHTACQEHGARLTEHLVSLMRLFEAFTLYAFRTGAPYFVDSGTLLGCVRHRGIIPWDNDLDLAMLDEDFFPFLESFSSEKSGLLLDRDGYGDPNGCVWFKDEGSGIAGIDLSGYEANGRALMNVVVQREWPIDAWRSHHDADSWTYDFEVGDLTDMITLPSFAGPQRTPRRWRERLARHYDDLKADPALCARAAREVPFPPERPPVELVPSFSAFEEGWNATQGSRPFAYRDGSLSRRAVASETCDRLLARTERPFAAVGPEPAFVCVDEGDQFVWLAEPDLGSESSLAARSITAILTDDDFRGWGRVHVLHQSAGSTLVVPAGWLVRAHVMSDATVRTCTAQVSDRGAA